MRRACAAVVDLVLLAALVVVLAEVIGRLSAPSVDGTGDMLASFACATVIWFIYLTAATWRWGTTLGGRVAGLRIVALDGAPLSLLRSCCRYLVIAATVAVSAAVWPLVFVLIALTILDPSHRGPHDQLAGSVIVRAADTAQTT